jgi:hypothetical protein
MKAADIKKTVIKFREGIEKTKSTMQLRKIMQHLSAIERVADNIERDEKIIAAQGQAFFEVKDGLKIDNELKLEE